MSRALGGHPKVILQGDGGDEIFGGYARYPFARHMRTIGPLARPLASAALRTNATSRLRRPARLVCIAAQKDAATQMAMLLTTEIPGAQPDTFTILGPRWRQATRGHDPFVEYKRVYAKVRSDSLVHDLQAVDQAILLPDIYLEKVDRATMAAGIEARVPFLDNDLRRHVNALPRSTVYMGGRRKGLLKKSLEETLPSWILDAPKTGFGVPYGEWLRGPLRQAFLEVVMSPEVSRCGIIDKEEAQARFEAHCSARSNNLGNALWRIFNLAIWIVQNGETNIEPCICQGPLGVPVGLGADDSGGTVELCQCSCA